MRLSITALQGILDQALEHVDVPADCAAALEGSLAEGFGNTTSDLDFVLIVEGAHDYPVMPALLFIDGRRVEIRVRSSQEMRRQHEQVRRALASGRQAVGRLDEEDLDRCQRFAGATVLRGGELIETLRGELPSELLEQAISTWFLGQARKAARCAAALDALNDDLAAASWASSALTAAAKAWVARHGETYLAKKWLGLQLTRARCAPAVRDRILELQSPDHGGIRPRAYTGEVIAFLPKLGADTWHPDPDRLVLRRRPGVTTWQIGARIHVVRDRHDVFVLSPQAAAVWRSLTFERPVPEILARHSETRAEAGRFIAELHRLGLIGLAWHGTGPLPRRAGSGAVPTSVRPVLTLEGGALPEQDGLAIVQLPIDAKRFASAGGALGYACMVVENAREDALGALDAGQWSVFERVTRRMLRHLCTSVLSAYGVHPLPAIEEAHLVLSRGTLMPPRVRQRIQALEHQPIPSRKAALEHLDALEALAAELRARVRADLFPACFTSTAQWEQALDIGYEWGRLGTYVGATFPLEQARDLIATGGHQPNVRAGAQTFTPS